MSLARAIFTVGGLTMVSRLCGFARDFLTATILGAGPLADAFFIALKLPNFFRRLFAEGAFSAAFVPMVSGRMEHEGPQAGRRLAERALALMIAFLLPFVALGMVFMPWVVTVIAPGFVDDPVKFTAAVDLARITFPYLLLISIVALLGGLLNSAGRFAPFAAAPILFNLTLIAALLLAREAGGEIARYMAYGVVVSGVLQLVMLLVSCIRAGVAPALVPVQIGPDMRKLLKLMVPGMIAGGVLQINLMIDTILASLLPSGAVSWLFYADRLYQLPLGVIGIAIGTALLPGLSRAIAAHNLERTTHLMSRALEYSLLLALPAALGLAALCLPITGALFQYGRFTADDTLQTGLAMAAYAIGIPAYVAVKVLNAAFFARQDTVTPVRISVISTVLNTALSLALIQILGHVGIALGTGLAAWISIALMLRALKRLDALTLDRQLLHRLPRILLAGLVMVIVLAGLLAGAYGLGLDTGSTPVRRIIWLALLIGTGALTYGGAALVLGAGEIGELRQLLGRRKADPAPATSAPLDPT